MLFYILKRLGQSTIVMFGVTLIVFAMLFVSGDPVSLLLPLDASEADRIAMRHAMGFDDPFFMQYGRFLINAIQGDLGVSLRHQVPALDLIKQMLPNSIVLVGSAMLIAILVAVPAGMIAAIRRNSIFDTAVTVMVLIGQAMPVYWLGLILILIFAVNLGIFPTGGIGGLKHLVLPAVTLGAFSMSRIARLTRSGLLEVLGQDYIRTAKSLGLRSIQVVTKYALKNTAIPLVTLIGMEFGTLLGGAIVTESIFSWPGLGRLVVNAINDRDYALVQAIVTVLSIIFVFINLVVDIIYTWLDPRVRLIGKG